MSWKQPFSALYEWVSVRQYVKRFGGHWPPNAGPFTIAVHLPFTGFDRCSSRLGAQLFEDLRSINLKKSVLLRHQQTTFLGMVFDSRKMWASLSLAGVSSGQDVRFMQV